jgi:hypothetical protein
VSYERRDLLKRQSGSGAPSGTALVLGQGTDDHPASQAPALAARRRGPGARLAVAVKGLAGATS